jgi:hypothetical protein
MLPTLRAATVAVAVAVAAKFLALPIFVRPEQAEGRIEACPE